MKTLVLNADYTPFDIVSYRQSIVMLYVTGTVYALDYYSRKIKDSKDREYPVPAVVVLKSYVDSSNKTAPYNKLNVYARDRFVCQYCFEKVSREEATIDHVIPRSKWNKLGKNGSCTCFENVVTSCKKCNYKKADKTPEEAGMKLNITPKKMTRAKAFHNKLACLATPTEWKPYINVKK